MKPNPTDRPGFLIGGGEMGALMRAHDWSGSPLGLPETWPQSLHSAMSICLNSLIVSALYWGPEFRMLYNDAYAPALAERHPWAFGRPVAEVWAEIWDVLGPQLTSVVETGQGFATENQRLMMKRRGRIEETYWVYSFTPIRGENNAIVGIFVSAMETTGQVLADRKAAEANAALHASEERFRFALDAAGGVGTWDWDIVQDRVYANARFAELYNISPERAAAGAPVSEFVDGIHADDRERVGREIEHAVKSAGEFASEYRTIGADSAVHWVFARGRCFHDGNGRPSRFPGVAVDITVRKAAEKALHESEARFRNMADHAPVMMWVTDPTGYCTYLNKRWYDFTGQTEAEALGLGWAKATHPEDQNLAEEAFLSANAAQGPFRIEYRLRCADGTYRWAIDAASPRFDANGEFLGYVGSVIDIDERKRSEEKRNALIELSDRFRDLDDTADLSFAAAEIMGRTLGVSRAGYGTIDPVAETITIERDWNAPGINSLAGVLHFRDYGSYIEDLKRGDTVVFADAEKDPRTAATADALKAISAQSVVNMPVTEQGGFVALLYLNHESAREWSPEELGFVHEVAERTHAAVERRRAEQERRELAVKFEGIANSIDQMIWSTLPDGYHDYYNQRWYDYTGVPPGSTDGEAWSGMFHPDDQERAWAKWRHSLETGEPYHIEYRLRHRSGVYRWVLGRAQPVRADDGRVTRWFGTCTDIQDIVDARNVLARSREDLEQLVRERTDALLQTEEALRQAQKMEAVGQLTGGIAHDFNNLLAGIVGSLDLMQTRISQGRTDTIERYAKAAMSSAQRAAALTHRLLAFSRRQPLDPKPVNANALIAGMEDLLRRTIGPLHALEMVTAGGLWTTLCDPNQLESAILNLAINARDAMPEGGKLTIETANAHLDDAYVAARRDVTPGQYVAICISDTGSGMPPEIIARAFEPFFTTKPLGQGTGLGLSMVYGFAKQSEGHLRIYSEVGKGTTVKIYLPRHRGIAADETGPSASVAETPRAEAGETVLVVEDEPVIRDLIVEVLQDLGYRALEAADGPSGLRILQSRERVDLLVTDVGLPGLNGRQLADHARVQRPDLKVLFITGYAENATLANGFLDHGMEMITKPFAVDALANKIRMMIQAK